MPTHPCEGEAREESKEEKGERQEQAQEVAPRHHSSALRANFVPAQVPSSSFGLSARFVPLTQQLYIRNSAFRKGKAYVGMS